VSRRRPGRRAAAAAAVLGAVALLALVLPAAGFLWFLRAAAAPPADPELRAEGIAVLTGGADRVETGLRLLLADGGGGARLIVSGAHRDATLADLVRGAGLPPEAAEAVAGRATLGRAAATTRGNAAEIAAWARREGIGSIRVVTAGYHMPRALLELRRALPAEVALLPHPVVPASLRDGRAGPQRAWRLLLGEYAKLVGAWLGLSRPGPGDRGGDGRGLAPRPAATQDAPP
jgi:uncharacterized SAM-binding protein YcdF (DUF218 family)